MTSRLSEFAGCKATVEEFFPAVVAPIVVGQNCPSSADGFAAVLAGTMRYDGDSSLGLQLACLLQQVQSTTSRSEQLTRDRSQKELTARVRQNSWSVTECLEHLALTTQAFLPPIAEIIAKTPKLTRSRSLRCDMLAKLLIRTLEPPYRLRHKVLPHLAPQQNDFPSAWKAFLKSQEKLGEITRSAVGLAIDTVKIQSPVCSRMSYSVYGALGILSAHQRRHLWQMERILRSLDLQAS